MELIERDSFLRVLHATLEGVWNENGHCVFIGGEAGIGKTSLLKAFIKDIEPRVRVLQGTCDALFTPRPLAPLFDILPELDSDVAPDMDDRTVFFAGVLHSLKKKNEPTIIIFEDVHWADEATLDFIKFLARRIGQTRTMFVLTYRDNEISAGHPIRAILGQLSRDSFTRLELPPLSRPAVAAMAKQRGYDGKEVYDISGGNPFYVNEILASYSIGVPENVKDSILSVFSRQDGITSNLWRLLSIIPTGLELPYLQRLLPGSNDAISDSLAARILLMDKGMIFFKHELYRRTIEASLSPLVRVELNKKLLHELLPDLERNGQIERIIHHAKNANEYDVVTTFAPIGARNAAAVGAHLEASTLFLTAIDYYQGTEKSRMVEFFEGYAYECYLVNQIKDSIIYTTKAQKIWKDIGNAQQLGGSLRFLSRLWWFDGNRKLSEQLAFESIEALKNEPSSFAKAMSLSNLSQLMMLSDQGDECVYWGEQAIAMAKELGDLKLLSHSLNNVGTVKRSPTEESAGFKLLSESLQIAIDNGFHEHAARAYTNLSSNYVKAKKYTLAKQVLADGIRYCEERDLLSWVNYMQSWLARSFLETGAWADADELAERLLQHSDQSPVVKITAIVIKGILRMRRGEKDALPLLEEGRRLAFDSMELQRIVPAMVAMLEFEWLSGQTVIDDKDIDTCVSILGKLGNLYENSELVYWLFKGRKLRVPIEASLDGYDISPDRNPRTIAGCWRDIGNPFLAAFTLFDGDEAAKREAVTTMLDLGAIAVAEKMKREMRSAGIRKIPRGARSTTKSNVAEITERELDILQLLQDGLQNKEIGARLFISPKTVDHHISSILFKLDVNSRVKAVQEALRLAILK